MKCHICKQEMRVVKRVYFENNDMHQAFDEIWRCDDCDKWWKRLWRLLIGNRT